MNQIDQWKHKSVDPHVAAFLHVDDLSVAF